MDDLRSDESTLAPAETTAGEGVQTSRRPSYIKTDLPSPLPQPCFRDPRLNLTLIRYTSLLPRIHHTLLPYLTFWQIAVQLFLDANALYVLVQLASDLTRRAWWIALAGYALSALLQYVGIHLLYEGVYLYRRAWQHPRPDIAHIYFSRALFDLSCIRHYDYYCFLQTIRWSAWCDFRDGRRSLTSGLLEEAAWRMQDWPLVLTLLPRAGICLALLTSYTFAGSTSTILSASRDPAFWRNDSKLSGYAVAVLASNALLTGLRWSLLVAAALLYLLLNSCRHGIIPPSHRRAYSQPSPHDLPNSATDEDTSQLYWRDAAHIRIRDAMVFCASRHRPRRRTSKPFSHIVSPPLDDAIEPTVEPMVERMQRTSLAISSEAGHHLLERAASFQLAASSSQGHSSSSHGHHDRFWHEDSPPRLLPRRSDLTIRTQNEEALWQTLTSSARVDGGMFTTAESPELTAITEVTEDGSSSMTTGARMRTVSKASTRTRRSASVEVVTSSAGSRSSSSETLAITEIEEDPMWLGGMRKRSSPTDTFGGTFGHPRSPARSPSRRSF